MANYLYGEETQRGNITIRTSTGTKMYEGVIVPTLPEYDTAAFPYICVTHYSFHSYQVRILENPLVHSVRTFMGATSDVVSTTGEAKILYLGGDLEWDDGGIWQDTNAPSFTGGPLWTNHDILSTDGTIYQSASPNPIPMKLDDIVRYLYNGHEFPALPGWDNDIYPYAIMTPIAIVCTTTPFYYDGEFARVDSCDRIVFSYDGFYYDIPYKFSNAQWSTADGIWSNHDILNEDGALYLAASSPIPVTTAPAPDATSMVMGWLVGRAVRMHNA